MRTGFVSSRVALLSVCLAVLTGGAAEARDLKVIRKTIAPAEAVPAQPVAVRDVTPAAKAASAQAPDSGVNLACTRKVKVIYAGYGEADRANCPSTAAASTAAPVVAAQGKTASNSTVQTQ